MSDKMMNNKKISCIYYGEMPFNDFPSYEEIPMDSETIAYITDATTKKEFLLSVNSPYWIPADSFKPFESFMGIKQENSDIEKLRKERDAAIADLTEFAMFAKRQTICNFCMYDDEDCKGRDGDNSYMNECFKWRGPV